MARPRKRKASEIRVERAPQPSDGEEELGSSSRHFVQATAADRYLTHQSLTFRKAKISDSQFSDLVSKPFTKSTFFASLPQAPAEHASSYKRSYHQWTVELDSGFNLLFYGVGSKRETVNDFAGVLRERGEVLVFEAFRNDVDLGVEEILRGLEMVRQRWEGDKKVKGKGKATAQDGQPEQLDIPPLFTLPNPNQSVAVLTRRLHALIDYFSSENAYGTPIYLFFHSLTLSQNLTSPFGLETLLRLANCKGFRLIISVDNAQGKWAYLFDTRHRFGSYAPHYSIFSPDSAVTDETLLGEEQDEQDEHDESLNSSSASYGRSFNFVHHHIPTFSPFSLEAFHSGLLASLFPSGHILAIDDFPTSRLFSKKKGLKSRGTIRIEEDGREGDSDEEEEGEEVSARVEGSQSKSSLLSILRSVTARSQHIFLLLAESQLSVSPSKKPSKSPIPPYSLPAAELLAMAEELFLSLSEKQFQTLVAEFRDHGVFKEAEGMVWIPMSEGQGENGTERPVLQAVVREIKAWLEGK
ncbi:hypothetical protein BT69DRAFT_1276591 [Atractiella rhizophila]|nr:hypothetical protein BT69DRAFT_1276591 [Atractiella rhizophila]